MKLKYYHLFVITLLVSCMGCNNNKESVVSGFDYITEEERAVIDILNTEFEDELYTKNIDSVDLESIFPKNGMLKVNELRPLNIELLKHALYMTNPSNYSYYGDNGLAYVWGGKNHAKKTTPAKVKRRGVRYDNRCQEGLYGVDCSGFVYQLFLQSGLKITHHNYTKPQDFANAQYLSQPKNWEEALELYAQLDPLKAIRINEPKLEDIESGDILFFYNSEMTSKHIGVCLRLNNGDLIFFDSSGYSNGKCSTSQRRGPRRLELTNKILSRWSPYKHGVIKFKREDEIE